MGRYIARRLLQAVPMLFLLSIALFILVNVAPGGPLAGHGRTRRPDPEKAEILKRQFGLDQPLNRSPANGQTVFKPHLHGFSCELDR